jgi:hypothetical protein
VKTETSPLVIAACPELGPANHQTFGDVVSELLDMYRRYHECRVAAIARARAEGR